MLQSDAYLLDIRCQQRQRRQCRRPYGKSLARCGRCVAQSIQSIGTFAHLSPQTAHLGIATGIVGYGAVGIRRKGYSQRREHTDGGDTYTVEPLRHVVRCHHVIHVKTRSAEICQNYRHADRNDGNRRRDHTRPYAGNDDRCRARLRAVGDFTCRAI